MEKPNEIPKESLNPYAYPIDGPYAADALRYGHTGMTLRDYFAAKAMQAIINKISDTAEPTTKGTMIQVSIESYSIADEMLKQRNQ